MALFFGTSKPDRSLVISRAVKAKTVRKLAPKIYTDDLKSRAEDIIRRHRLEIAAHFYPGAVISHRSAIESGVSPAGRLYLTVSGAAAPYRTLPGLEIRLYRGPEAQPDDIKTGFGDGEPLFTASQARALLENMQISRARGTDEPKTLSESELERWIDRQVRALGAAWLDQMRAKTAELAQRLDWKWEHEQFERLADAIQGKPSAHRLSTDVARARAAGQPFDPERDQLFRNLQARLATETFRDLPAPPAAEFENRAFWEAYFSNFIEGTKFTVEEAQAIIQDSFAALSIKHKRPEDAHDVRETYRLIVDPRISAASPDDSHQMLELIKRRHARMMASRVTVEPGVFKTRANVFGSRVFVSPDLVEGTLLRAWPLGRSLPSPVGRALYVLFLLAEVHPFLDGNGRISRLGMNAEMERSGLARLILPTSFRTDYLTVLEALTVGHDPEPYIRFGHKLVEMNMAMPFGSFEDSYGYFRKTRALDESGGALSLAAVTQP